MTSVQGKTGQFGGRGERDDQKPGPKNVTSVGGLVVGAAGVLLVKMAYGPTKGKYMMPGGIVEPGETLDSAVVREVLEETGVRTRLIGICGIRSRHDELDNDTYVIFLLEPTDGSPRSDGYENEDARYFTLEELEADEVTELSRSMGKRALLWDLSLLTFSEDYDWERAGQNKRTWRLFR